MTSELFTVYGKRPVDTVAATSTTFTLYSDLFFTHASAGGVSGGTWLIRIPQGTAMKIWDTKLMAGQAAASGTIVTEMGFTSYIWVSDTVGDPTTNDGGLSGALWQIKGQDQVATTPVVLSGQVIFTDPRVYSSEKCARPEHIIESPDGRKLVAFLLNQATSGQASVQYTIEITDDISR
jgi:hypothetical protein